MAIYAACYLTGKIHMDEQNPQNAPDRQEELRKIRKEHIVFYEIFGGVILIGIGIYIGSILFSEDQGYITNLYTEFISIGITVFILNVLAKRRGERQGERQRERQLFIDAANLSNEGAKAAINEIRRRDWWKKSLFRNAVLRRANWKGILLGDADLSGSNLTYAVLEDADLRRTDLRGTDLSNSNIQGALVWRTKCDAKTILPDGQPCNNLADFLFAGAIFQIPVKGIWYEANGDAVIECEISAEARDKDLREMFTYLLPHYQQGRVDVKWIAHKLSLSEQEAAIYLDEMLNSAT